jgi:S1-C subfamily serine protease
MATTQTRPDSDAVGPAASGDVPQWRERLIPKTAIGMSMMIIAAAVGAAFSGAVLYAYYEYRLSQNEDLLAAYEESFENAQNTIRAEADDAKSEIRKELEPLRQLQAEGETIAELIRTTEEAVWFVSTLDEAGQPSVGSAFAVASGDDQTLMLTSLHVVRAATRQPGPAVRLRKGEQELEATLWTWHEERDLALLVVRRGGIKKLEPAPDDPPLQPGERIFAVSGLGGSGGAVAQGAVADTSGAGIQHTVPIGAQFQGGPLVNSKGEVIAVASRAYTPLGFTTDAVFFAPPIRAACDRVLSCPGGNLTDPGQRR